MNRQLPAGSARKKEMTRTVAQGSMLRVATGVAQQVILVLPGELLARLSTAACLMKIGK
jgi:hypothetical protein